MFPSFTCNLSQCMWMIQLKDRTYTVTMSPYNIPIFGKGNEGTYSLIGETNSGRNYSTARVSIQVQLTPMEQSLINPLLPIIIVVLIITGIVTALIVVITILCLFIVQKRKKSSDAIEQTTKSHKSKEGIELHQSNLTSRDSNTGYANKSDLQSLPKEYIELPVNISGVEYMTIDETPLIALEPETNIQTDKASYYSNETILPSNEIDEKVKKIIDHLEKNPSQPNAHYIPMSVVKEENKFVPNYISAKDFPGTYQQYVASGMGNDSLFAVEFQALNEESKKYVESSDEARKESNIMCKNPLKNILPYDENRVVLESPHFDCNYINASYINDFQLIASIHPTGDTLQDFLQMIYQTEASMVIMLTTRKQKAKMNSGVSTRVCYWPKKDEPLRCNPYETSLISSNETTAFVKQAISLKNTLEKKDHSFIHCISSIWNEDSTIIELNSAVTLLSRAIKQKQEYPLNPIIIHCEDGISKTGIFLTVFNVIKELNIRKSSNIFNAVKNLRKQRMRIVPTMVSCSNNYNFSCISTVKPPPLHGHTEWAILISDVLRYSVTE